MSGLEWSLLLGGAVVAGFVQGLSGFAFSMVSMSIWVWALDPKLAAVMAVFGSLVGQVIGVFSVPRTLSLPTDGREGQDQWGQGPCVFGSGPTRSNHRSSSLARVRIFLFIQHAIFILLNEYCISWWRFVYFLLSTLTNGTMK